MLKVPREQVSSTSHTQCTFEPQDHAGRRCNLLISVMIILGVGNGMSRTCKNIFLQVAPGNIRNQTMFLTFLQYVPCTRKVLLLWHVVYNFYTE